MQLPIRLVRLTSDPQEPGLSCCAKGLSLSGRPLLMETAHGLAPRSRAEVQEALNAAYGQEAGLQAEDYSQGLKTIARHLDKGDVPLAMIASLMLKLPDAPEQMTVKNDIRSSLTKAGYSQAENRDVKGRWANGSTGSVKQPRPSYLRPVPDPIPNADAPAVAEAAEEGAIRTAPNVIARLASRTLTLLTELAEVADFPLAVANFVLIPSNKSNVSSGEIPDAPGLIYRCDEGLLSVYRRHEDGSSTQIYYGAPDEEGYYRDDQGLIIGRNVGKAALLDPQSFIDIAAQSSSGAEKDKQPNIDGRSTQQEDPSKACPPPTPENINGRSPRSLAYQTQITGLPPGWDVLLNGVRFDGCDQASQMMLEAKALMPKFLVKMDDNKLKETRFYRRIMRQAERQSMAAGVRGDNWYFADKRFADFFGPEFRHQNLLNVFTYWRDAVYKFFEDAIFSAEHHAVLTNYLAY